MGYSDSVHRKNLSSFKAFPILSSLFPAKTPIPFSQRYRSNSFDTKHTPKHSNNQTLKMKFSIVACFLAATAMAMPAANPYEVADNDIILIQRSLEARGLGSLVKPITNAFKKLKGGPKRPADIVPDLKNNFKVSHDGYGTTTIERWGTKLRPENAAS